MSPDWPYRITIEHANWPEVEDWCLLYIGEFDQDWYKMGIDPADWVIDNKTRTTWLFRTPEHATMFTLRWA